MIKVASFSGVESTPERQHMGHPLRAPERAGACDGLSDKDLSRRYAFAMVDQVVFEVNGETVAVGEPEARILAEKLIGFAAGNFDGDVALLEAHGHDRDWLDGACALGQAIEDVVTGTRDGQIPLDPTGKAADAAFAVYSLPGPSSWDATSGAARLRAQPGPRLKRSGGKPTSAPSVSLGSSAGTSRRLMAYVREEARTADPGYIARSGPALV
jgi:hypothetical protein